MDFKLTDVQEMTRDMVRDFAQNEVKPAALILDKNPKPEDCIPWDLLKKASKLGLRTAAIPEEWGGEGADYTTLALILLELGAADHGFASIIRGCYTESPRLVHELNPEQRDEFLPKFLKDDTYLLGLGRTEPDAGTDSHFLYDEPGKSIQTYAEKQGDEYVINGTKHFISSGGVAKLYFLYVPHRQEGPHLHQHERVPGALRHARLHHRPLPQQVRPPAAPQRRTGVPERPRPRPLPHRQRGRGLGFRGRRRRRPAEGLDQGSRRPAAVRPAGRGRQPGHRQGLLRGSAQLLPAAHPGRQTGHRAAARGHRPGPHEGTARGRRGPALQVAAGPGRAAWTTIPRWACCSRPTSTRSACSIASKAIGLFGGMGTGDDDFPISKYVRDVYTFLHGFSTTEVALLIGAPTA